MAGICKHLRNRLGRTLLSMDSLRSVHWLKSYNDVVFDQWAYRETVCIRQRHRTASDCVPLLFGLATPAHLSRLMVARRRVSFPWIIQISKLICISSWDLHLIIIIIIYGVLESSAGKSVSPPTSADPQKRNQ